ncbi:MAG: LysE family translocator [Alphaproteobacteria bacterium]
MTYELVTAFILFAFVSTATPGPNNLMLMASGANFGFRRTIPHMLGIGLGFIFMVVLVGLGLNQLFETYPIANTILKFCSVAYLLYLAWKIANASAPKSGEVKGKPFTFVQAALFQWVNPKAWSMALSIITIYTPDTSFKSLFIIACILGCINLPTVSCWTILGQQMKRFLTNETRLRAFNYTMATLLVLSLYPVVINN